MIGGTKKVFVELIGRDHECAAIDAALKQATSGHRAALILRGEAGIGKSALMDYARDHAGAFTVLSASGVEFEAELPFSTLHQLLMPVLDLRTQIPKLQARALEAAFALREDPEVHRFAVYAATLSLIAAAAASQPVLCLIDDVHWADSASFEAIRFASRRLSADSVAFIFGEREDEPPVDIDANRLHVPRLDDADARSLIGLVQGRTEPTDVVDHLVASAAGNPLALVELSGQLHRRHLIGTDPTDIDLATPLSIQRLFERRTAHLEAPARSAVTLVAACGSQDLAVIGQALRQLDLSVSSLDAAAEAGLLALAEATVTFCHPLMRAAAYHSASPTDRGAAHRALADTRALPSVQRAWHQAMAAEGPDAEVAAGLEEAARQAGRLGGPAAEARMLVVAARLTPDPDLRALRLVAAVDASAAASRQTGVERLLSEAHRLAEDPVVAAEVTLRQGRDYFNRGLCDRAIEACEHGLSIVPVTERELTGRLWASIAAYKGMSENIDLALEAVAAGRRAGVQAGGPAEMPLDSVELGTRAFGGYPLPASLVERCLTSAVDEGTVSAADEAASWLSLVGEFQLATSYLVPAMNRQRRLGQLSRLAFNLDTIAEMRLFESLLPEARTAAEESSRICSDLGLTMLGRTSTGTQARIAATAGREEDARALIEILERDPTAPFEESLPTAVGRLESSLGQPERAIPHLQRGLESALRLGIGEPYLLGFLPDLVEAYAECGRPDDAADVLGHFERSGRGTSRPWAQAMGERCRGLIAVPERIDEHFVRALELHGQEAPFDTGRTMLAYGRSLRRADRRQDAIDIMRRSLERFTTMGADLWSARVRSELESLGDQPAAHAPSVIDLLTPQEFQVALAVAAGATNRETASRLFLSVKTIEYHLRNTYRKLSIRSRTELAGVVLASRSVP